MRPIKNTILHFRRQQPSLQGLVGACGPEPSRPPPSEDLILELRRRIARKLKVNVQQADAHHPASPWRFELVRRIMVLAKDPDVHVPNWLEHGTPVGIAETILPSGLLPRIDERAQTSSESLRDRVQWTHNHPSFDQQEGSAQPAHALLQDLVDAGHALIFSSVDTATAFLGSRPVPSPLGDVIRIKPDGQIKHRLIQDLKASSVNAASQVPERQVLPRFTDHARDLALASVNEAAMGGSWSSSRTPL